MSRLMRAWWWLRTTLSMIRPIFIRTTGGGTGMSEALREAYEAGWQAAISLAIARISAYEECENALAELRTMAETGAHHPDNRAPDDYLTARGCRAEWQE